MIEYTNAYRQKLAKELGSSFIYLADEFFIKAGHSFPKADYYDDFYQMKEGRSHRTIEHVRFLLHCSFVQREIIKYSKND